MNHPVPKQFHLLAGKPVLYYSIHAFLSAYADMEVILVLPEDRVGTGQEVIDAYFDYKQIRITIGGATRFESVQKGLAMVEEESVVMVHDAVRCLVSPALIRRCYEAVLQFGSAIPVTEVTDSLRMMEEDGSSSALNRDKIRVVQTPQAFYSKMIIPAFQIDYKERFTDEATVMEGYGMKVHLIQGEATNFKLTRPSDFIMAERILSAQES